MFIVLALVMVQETKTLANARCVANNSLSYTLLVFKVMAVSRK